MRMCLSLTYYFVVGYLQYVITMRLYHRRSDQQAEFRFEFHRMGAQEAHVRARSRSPSDRRVYYTPAFLRYSWCVQCRFVLPVNDACFSTCICICICKMYMYMYVRVRM